MISMIRLSLTIICGVLLAFSARVGFAGVVVLQNLTSVKIGYILRDADGHETRQTIVPTDIASIPTTRPISIVLGDGVTARAFALPVNSIHYFEIRNNVGELISLTLPGVEEKADPSGQPSAGAAALALGQPGKLPAAGIYKIRVALLVDSDNPRVQAAWEKRVRKRLAEASDIFEHHCRARFEVAAVGHWTSDPSVRSFDQALLEFAQKVRPAPARLAIGFTGRYEWVRDEKHLGGTHGALASHILIRESPGQVSEPERLEVLVHELGHFLGAAHTSDKNSVMRPALGDRRSTSKSFRIGFDAPNTLVMSLIAEEMRSRNLWHPSALTPAAKSVVRGAYMALAQTIPKDPVSTSSIESLGPQQASLTDGPNSMIIYGARHVLMAILQAARENQQLPVSSKDPRVQVWRTGDELTTYYVRRAAAAAKQLSPQFGPSAFLLGLGVALDDSNIVRDKPAIKEVWQKIERDDQRQSRLLLLGTPTILKRHNLTRHFTISAAMVVICGPQGAESSGLDRELLDSRNGDGFSFSDLCADMAGVIFATHVRDGGIPLHEIATRYNIGDYIPKLEGLPDDLPWDSFVKQYGEANTEQFQRQRADLYHRIMALPAYRAQDFAKKKP
jgi:hypothetical protein